MNFLAISDIHGAIGALRKVLEESFAEWDISLILFAGDLHTDPFILYKLLRKYKVKFVGIYGNHDRKDIFILNRFNQTRILHLGEIKRVLGLKIIGIPGVRGSGRA